MAVQQWSGSETYDKIPMEAKSAVLALSVIINRINSLPRSDRDDLFELVKELQTAQAGEETYAIVQSMEEILAQTPVSAVTMKDDGAKLSKKSKLWAKHVGAAIRKAREGLDWSQSKLAEEAGLPQGHLSRIENADLTVTHLTLKKIAKALSIEVGQLDPCTE
ncbi:MAG: helix-turn-helix transcriptional regulator [Planctomycetota bacterium]|jgi:DNA-binding Xre family transcriptional regulator